MMPVLILAAGASSRMRGTDKLLLDVDGMPLLRRQACMALEASGDVRIALPPRPHERYDVVDDLRVQPVEVTDAAHGMSASLRALFATLEPENTYAMVLLGDLPDLNTGDLRAIMRATHEVPDAMIWRGATQTGKGGHPMIVARPLFSEFQTLSGDSGGNSIAANLGQAVHLVPLTGNRARQDLDTPEDWAAWRANRSTSDAPR
ncbi:MAG: nucleotidyltransferase family protein [Pseudomonadota bacterium]